MTTNTKTPKPFPRATAEQLAAVAAAEAAADAARDAIGDARKGAAPADVEAAREAWHVAADAWQTMLRALPSVPRASLTRRFDRWAWRVLSTARIVRDVGEGRFVFVQPEPTAEAYLALRTKAYTHPAEDQVSDAFSTLTDLAEQLREWYDNLPESFQQGDKGSTLDDSANTLENVAGNEPSQLDRRIADLPVLHLPHDCSSRGDSCADACARLMAVAEAARDAIVDVEAAADAEQLPEWMGSGGVEWTDAKGAKVNLDDNAALFAEWKAEAVEALTELADTCEEAAGEAEGVEFPGMY